MVQQQHAAFLSGQIPSHAEQAAFLSRVPDDPCPGIYGVYRVVNGVLQLSELDPSDPIRAEYSRIDSSDDSGGDRGSEPGEDNDIDDGGQGDGSGPVITRTSNPRRYSGADMINVAPRFNPVTFEPNPALLVMSPSI